MKTRFWITFLLPALLCACLEDRTFDIKPIENGKKGELKKGSILINEIQPNDSIAVGEKGDWVELYNTTDSTLLLEPNRFWMTESRSKKFKYSPKRTFSIPPKGFVTVYFINGGQDTSSKNIVNTTGSLSKSGEFIGFYFLGANGDTIALDTITFPAGIPTGKTYGRLPDGGSNFSIINTPSRSLSNNGNGFSQNKEPFTGLIIINEIAPNESITDWVEIYSTLQDTITLKKGRWFFTDDLTKKTQYALPVDFVLQPKTYTIVECKDPDGIADAKQLRALFNLSSTKGEAFGFYYKNDKDSIITIAEQTFPAGIATGKTYSRSPNLTGAFKTDTSPSKGQANP